MIRRVLLSGSLAALAVTTESCAPGPPAAPSAATAPASRPEAPAYKVLKQGGDDQKDNWHVELAQKVGAERLRGIADEIRDRQGTGKARAYFWFHLPGAPLSSPWAIAFFEPTPRIEIQGLTADQESQLIARAPRHDGAIGRWVEDDLSRHLLTIYRDGAGLHLATAGLGGFESTTDIVAVGEPNGRRFERREPSSEGDCYIISDQGDLELRAGEKLVYLARKANP